MQPRPLNLDSSEKGLFLEIETDIIQPQVAEFKEIIMFLFSNMIMSTESGAYSGGAMGAKPPWTSEID